MRQYSASVCLLGHRQRQSAGRLASCSGAWRPKSWTVGLQVWCARYSRAMMTACAPMAYRCWEAVNLCKFAGSRPQTMARIAERGMGWARARPHRMQIITMKYLASVRAALAASSARMSAVEACSATAALTAEPMACAACRWRSSCGWNSCTHRHLGSALGLISDS